jgi:hypothetical protein
MVLPARKSSVKSTALVLPAKFRAADPRALDPMLEL